MLKLPELDGTGGGRVYSGLEECPGLGTESCEEGLALTGVLISHSHRKGFSGSNENRQIFCPRQAGVDEVAKEHFKVLA